MLLFHLMNQQQECAHSHLLSERCKSEKLNFTRFTSIHESIWFYVLHNNLSLPSPTFWIEHQASWFVKQILNSITTNWVEIAFFLQSKLFFRLLVNEIVFTAADAVKTTTTCCDFMCAHKIRKTRQKCKWWEYFDMIFFSHWLRKNNLT